METRNHAQIVTCIGLANVDVIAQVDDDFLAQHHITKSASTLLDACTTGAILSKLKNPVFYPGGAAANMACGLAGLDVPTRFVGRTGDDTYAQIFRKGFAPYDIIFDTPPFAQKMTSTCLTLVTPDKDRSFAFCTDTAAWNISPSDLPDLPQDGSQYVYTECNTAQMIGSDGKSLLEHIADKYVGKGVKLVINLNDMELVRRSRTLLHALLKKDVTLFMGNVAELRTLFEVETNDEAFARALATGRRFAITDGVNGAYALYDGKIEHAPAQDLHAGRIVNTVGAGDQFAAGYIAALVNGLSPIDCCATGIDTATRIIQEVSARPSAKKALRA